MAKSNKSITLLPPNAEPPAPPLKLQDPGMALWRSILKQYDIRDAGGIALLAQICRAWDRCERLVREIERDGEILRDIDDGLKAHPAMKYEIQCQAFISRGLERLGINLQPLHASARRPGGMGLSWIPPTAAE